MNQLPELGCYTLAGAPRSPRDLIDEVRHAERLGLGAVFISERFNIKEAGALSGAVGAVSEQVGIATGVTNHTTRHPVVLGSFATTMHRLTGGRFALGLGRGIDPLFNAFGIPLATPERLEDIAGLLRRLWRGEVVVGHEGPAGSYPVLALDPSFDEDIPLMMAAFGPRSLDLAGRVFDGVLLHTFFTDETLQRSVRIVKESAERAGRDPSSVRVWSCLATVGDHLAEEDRLRKTVGRMATYLQGYGDLMVRTNGWEPAVLERFRADPVVAGFRGAFDAAAEPDVLEHLTTLIPAEWLAPAATGSAEACAAEVARQLELGADSVILHGASPAELAPVVEAYRDRRAPAAYDLLPVNPGATV